jgi:hypothetical protein
MSAVWLGGGYDKPLKPLRILKPVAVGAAIILMVYSLLPEHLRFSRAIILLATVDALVIFLLNRTIINVLTRKSTGWKEQTAGNVVIAGKADEVVRVKQMLEHIQRTAFNVIEIDPSEENPHVGSLNNLDEIIRVHRIDQVIYCARDLSSSDIIASMSSVDDKRVEFKIAPPESLYIIGSGSIEAAGDGSMMDVNSVQLLINRRKKRLMDVICSIALLLLSPVLILFQKKPLRLHANLLRVLIGKCTMVGYASGLHSVSQLPVLKPGILPTTQSKDVAHRTKMDVLYAKDYKLSNDLRLIASNIKNLGA